MITVLIPITEKPQEFYKSILALSGRADVNLVIGINERCSQGLDLDIKNATVKVYNNSVQREQMVNDLQRQLEGTATLIARKPFSIEDFNALTSQQENIVTCATKKRNKFAAFFVKIWDNLVKFVFGVKLFAGDPSLIYFDGELGQVLPQVANLSYATRVDRWKGASQTAVATSYPPAKLNQDKNFNLILLLCGFLSIAVGALVTTLVCVLTKVTVLAVIALMLLDLLCLVVFALIVMSYLFNDKVGRKEVKGVKE